MWRTRLLYCPTRKNSTAFDYSYCTMNFTGALFFIMTRSFDRFDIRSVAFCSRQNPNITGEEKLLSNVPEGPAMVDKDRAPHKFHFSNSIFMITIKIIPSSPRIVESEAPIYRGCERVVRIRLPRYLTVELSDIFVLDICARREVQGEAPYRVVCSRQEESGVW